jgi:3-hydroxyacyl-[acyl-carrier-protein] dehydratase
MKNLLSDNFFRILIIDEVKEPQEKVIAHIELNPKHPVYNGHFPGNPVLPGVCMVQMIKEVISLHLKKELDLMKADEVKFLNIVNPEINPELKMEITFKPGADDLIQAGVIITVSDQTFMKFRGTFK